MESPSAWSRALRDPSLRDLPYKIETNEYGQLVMSPRKPGHSLMQDRIVEIMLKTMPASGRAAAEFAVTSSKGVKVPDVIWISEERLQQMPEDAEACPVAPEICVEVLSYSNTTAEIDEKRALYFEQGALEVWTCDIKGGMRYFDPSGERDTSELAPSFPKQIE